MNDATKTEAKFLNAATKAERFAYAVWRAQEVLREAKFFHPDKFAPSGDAVFTKKMREVPVKRGKLTRVPFHVSRLMEFCTQRELVNQTGHSVYDWPEVVLKELVDNGLDACEDAGITPIISVEVKGDKIIISDNGPGIPESVIRGVLDYSIRVSSREAYCSPTRGAQGNALKTILPMGYVLDEKSGEDASAVTIIEAHGIAHRIKFSVDHILQEPKIDRLTKSSPVTKGTRITVTLPHVLHDGAERALLRIAEAFAWINPHLTLRVVWNGKVKLDFQATDPTWKKWQPSWPTSAHWYDLGRFRRYMAAHIAHCGKITVRAFISEFDGMTATAKQKTVLAETNSSHMTLRRYFGVKKANRENIAKLLAAIKAHTKTVKPATLGIIGKDHLYRAWKTRAATREPSPTSVPSEITAGIPHVSEFAFGLHREGLGIGDEGFISRKIIRGVNWSAAINDPFRQIGQGGESLESVLAAVKASSSQPIIAVLHVAKAHVSYTDRGKSAIVVEGEEAMAKKNNNFAADIIGIVKEGTKRWTRTVKMEERNPVSRRYRFARMTRERSIKFKEAAEEIMAEAYQKASGNGQYTALARQIMYAARQHIQRKTGKPLQMHISRSIYSRTTSRNTTAITGAPAMTRAAT